VLPAVAGLALGGAVVASQVSKADTPQRQAKMAADEALKRKNEMLMAAYGNRDSLEDMQKALELYNEGE
jgi:hypothetical protein